MSCSTIASSNKVVIGLDVIENDATLGNMTADQMFANFFGLSPQQFRDAMEASVTARSGELIMYDEAKVRNAHEIRDRKIRVSKSDGHIRLDHHKMLQRRRRSRPRALLQRVLCLGRIFSRIRRFSVLLMRR